MTRCRFSVVLPVRNGATHVGEALRSVLGQSSADLELIVLDSFSDDRTLEVVAEASRGDARVKIARAGRPLSIVESWARIFKLCGDGEVGGEFMTILGHDDRFLPDFLQVITELIDDHPAARLFQTHFRLIDSDGQVIRRCMPIPVRESLSDFFLARCWGVRDAFGTGYVFRPQDYVACGGIPLYPRLLFSDDMLWMRLLKNGEKISSEKTCFEYRVHSTSASAEHHTADKYTSFLSAFALFMRDLEAEFPFLLEHESHRAGLKKRIGSVLRYVEKGGYRVGLGREAFERDWLPLAARFDQLGAELQDLADVPMTFRYRPFKRLVHALRRAAGLN